MNRRSLLKTLMGGAAALAFDPERLLWVPGAKTIFIPKPSQLVPMGTIYGVCAGMPIMADTIDEAGPVFVRNGNWYRHVTLKRDATYYNQTIFAIPHAKVEVMVGASDELGWSTRLYEHQLASS